MEKRIKKELLPPILRGTDERKTVDLYALIAELAERREKEQNAAEHIRRVNCLLRRPGKLNNWLNVQRGEVQSGNDNRRLDLFIKALNGYACLNGPLLLKYTVMDDKGGLMFDFSRITVDEIHRGSVWITSWGVL